MLAGEPIRPLLQALPAVAPVASSQRSRRLSRCWKGRVTAASRSAAMTSPLPTAKRQRVLENRAEARHGSLPRQDASVLARNRRSRKRETTVAIAQIRACAGLGSARLLSSSRPPRTGPSQWRQTATSRSGAVSSRAFGQQAARGLEQERRRRPKSIPWTNLATPVAPISLCSFSRLRKSCPTTTADSVTVGRVVRVVGSEGVEGSASSRLLAACLRMLAQESNVDPVRVPEATGAPIRRHRRRDRDRLDGPVSTQLTASPGRAARRSRQDR